jgi:peptidoglycan/xylan/chitin deacetylase (PgdA/CDA1 family)
MNLVTFSIKTKGLPNFTRRLWTVFTRFGFSESRTKKALYSIINLLRSYNSAPTFFVPAVVLRRHIRLIAEIASKGAEIGIHGYVHNDYRTLSEYEQYKQTDRAISVFRHARIIHQGFRNPYLGWTEESLRVFAALGFTYESNEAVIHDVIDLSHFPPSLRSGFEKSLKLFQAIPCSAYTLRPHFEGSLLRIPTSIPDDEMLFDRLRITDPEELGYIWSRVMQRVYDYGGLYTLNLHPERGILCARALEILLKYAHSQPGHVWLTTLDDVARWWKERRAFRLNITPLAPEHWSVEATCTPRATLYARNLIIEQEILTTSSHAEKRVCDHRCVVQAKQCPCIALSPQTPDEVLNFLYEQGYPALRSPEGDAEMYSLYLNMPEGLGATREEQRQRCIALVQQVEQLDGPFLYFGCWPNNHQAALAISGDIDSVTVQDFFLRVLEVQ